ncbi:hypothetical protein TBLA_0A02860 [Henningerozyma blattae CBS 6284]|uniref:Ribosome-recycling factor, mitochondrial n=1 Tax=Henningerozyma blattae (strain ATCC 34711 / CBS 6284 / DSM 70876 / NBRC 10599 / NRRL Y-10934 / UCD 77-7) TaxID=1071380 RepID=I2GVD3_HENB6|nr:hypothetical protein TBLA_0A02860 [Tetrapisispora blattae CBS 6284]CCH58085.1 hypothetical protein TBLA_0A02860 [Tetrapisispora blattae CBS 6284]
MYILNALEICTKPVFLNKPLTNVRFLTQGLPLYKKVKGNKHTKNSVQREDDITEIVEVSSYAKRAENQFAETLEACKKALNDAKQGNSNPKIFNKMKLQNGKIFTDVATISTKGANALLVTVFDPKDVNVIISSIFSAGLNLNPQKIPNNNQQLKIALPPITTESRQKKCKELKEIFELYKNSSKKESLTAIRLNILKEMKNIQPRTDEVKKALQDVEKIHKEYGTKLQDIYKTIEKNMME